MKDRFCRPICKNCSYHYTPLWSEWPLSRECEIPWRFAALFCGTRHVKCYSYHARTSTKYLYGCNLCSLQSTVL